MKAVMSVRASTRTCLLATAGLVLVNHPSFGHHSAAMFEPERTVALAGTVKEFQWTNPHIWIQLEVPDGHGAVEEWSVEGGVPNRLFRSGWRPTTFGQGDKVVIIVRPMIDGGKAGIFVGAKLADGSTLGRFAEPN